MQNISTQLADLAITRSLLIHKVANGLSNDIAKVYNDIIDGLVSDLKSGKPINLKNMNATIKDLQSRFTPNTDSINSDLSDLAVNEGNYALKSVNTAVGVDIFKKVVPESTMRNILNVSLMSSGNGATTIKGWLKSVEYKSLNDIEKVVKLGVIQGDTNYTIANNLRNRLNMSNIEAQKIVRTATSHISNVAREEVFSANDDVIKGYQKHETLDSRTCLQCASVDGKFYKVNEKKPPATLHMNCRGVYVPVLKSFKELGLPFDEIPDGTRSSLDGYVSGKINFDKWIKTKDKTFIKDYLGTSRYELYKNNKLSLSDFVTNKGRILTVKELKAKYD